MEQTQKSKSGKSKKNRRKKKKLFKKALTVYLFILAIISIIAWVMLWNKLASYQSSIDADATLAENEKLEKRAPQICFTDKIASMTLTDWVNVYHNTYADDYNSDADIEEFMSGFISTDAGNTTAGNSLWKAPEYTDASPVYLISNDTQNIARFYLSKNGDIWTVSDIDLLINPSESFSITIPDECNLVCNGKVVDASHKTAADSFDVNGYEDSLNEPVAYCTYTINNLISEPEVNISNPESDYALKSDSEGNYYLTLSSGSEYQNKAQEFVDSLLFYYASGKNNVSANMASALNKVASGSKASSIIKQSLDGVTWRYPSNTRYDTSYSDVYVVANNCYFVDISYKDSSLEDDTYEIYRVYFLDTGSGFKIYNFEMK